mmetsp:Transcript_32586/g.45210  ORF Transcript_32586/g.45210 Transcript_32586/m.45210 type:complete len:96 (-) Transcript_32586:214-501(-)
MNRLQKFATFVRVCDVPCREILSIPGKELVGALNVMGRGDKRTRRGKIFKGSNGKCWPPKNKEDKDKPWMHPIRNPLVPDYMEPRVPAPSDIPYL